MALLNFFTDLRFYAPVAVLFYAAVTGSFAAGMAYISIAAVSTILVELPAGLFSDRRGRIVTLRLGAVSHAFSSVLMLGAAVFIESGNTGLWLLYGAAVLEGAGRAFYSGNNDSLVHDLTFAAPETGDACESEKAEKFAETLGYLRSMFQFALAIAALVGGFLAYRGWIFVMLPSALSLITALVIAFMIEIPPYLQDCQASEGSFHHLVASIKTFFGNPRMLANSIAEVTGYAVGEATYQFRVAFIKDLWPGRWLGAARMLDNLLAAAGFISAGRLIRRFGEYPLLIAGKVYGRIANLTGLLIPGILSPVIMSSPGIFYGITDVSRESLMHQLYNDRQRATLASVNSQLGAVALAVFAPLLGWVADRYGVLNALLFSQLLMLVPLGIDIVLYRKGKK